jgi:MoaA/NifB/PqqE/SkfB family radical SAM enzyme
VSALNVGFALTRHCNLRCPHCIRDDVTSVAELDVELVLRVLDEARARFDRVTAGFTGGEPMLHRRWDRLVDGLAERRVPYTFVSNGWHVRRFASLMDRYAPQAVRLSLSGADADVHDAERGRDSFRRVLLATAVLTSRRVPVSYSMIVDARSRHQLDDALRLSEQMGVMAIHYVLPQPVPASAERGSDLPPEEWWTVRRELARLAAGAGRTRVVVDYGAPFLGPAHACDSMALRRVYVDVHGRMSTCCQLSEYGSNESDVVADLHTTPFAAAMDEQARRVAELERIGAPRGADDPLAPFPCMRCARATGKTAWLEAFPASPWAFAADADAEGVALVTLRYSPRARRTVAVAASA